MIRITDALHEDLCLFMIVSRRILFRMRNISNKSCREHQNTHFLFSKFFRKSCRLWHHVGKRGRVRQATDDNTIRRMRFACWISKARHSRVCIRIWVYKNVKIYRTTILPILYACKTWSLTLREVCRLRVFENRVLRRIFYACTPHQIRLFGWSNEEK
jgi:hypothetical protein